MFFLDNKIREIGIKYLSFGLIKLVISVVNKNKIIRRNIMRCK